MRTVSIENTSPDTEVATVVLTRREIATITALLGNSYDSGEMYQSFLGLARKVGAQRSDISADFDVTSGDGRTSLKTLRMEL